MSLKESDLRGYQHRAKQHIIDYKASFLVLDMGLGKTVSTLTAFRDLAFSELEINKALVIAPKRVAEKVWTDEIKNWAHLNRIRVSIVAGTEKQRLQALNTPADVYTLGRDNVQWFVEQKHLNGFDMLIIDESSSFKNPASKRFKALKKISYLFKRIVLLTGTPAPNSLMDLWSQMFLIDRGERLGKTITAYRETYFTYIPQAFKYIPKPGAREKIEALISDVTISMKAEDYLDLPERLDNYIEVPLAEDVYKEYQRFEKEQLLILKDADITAFNAASLMIKLMQFSNGAVYDEDRGVHVIHDAKLDALEEIVEGGNSVLVAWSFQHDRDRIMARFKGKVRMRELKTNKDIDDWNNGDIDLLLMHPASGGHGLNLQRGGNTIVWFGIPNNLELYMQLNARLHRQGQTNVVIVHHLVAAGTLEAEIISLLRDKFTLQEALIRAVKVRL